MVVMGDRFSMRVLGERLAMRAMEASFVFLGEIALLLSIRFWVYYFEEIIDNPSILL